MNAAISMLGWWRDAGVDVVVGETPHDWLGTAAAAKKTVSPPVGHTLETLVDHLMTAEIAEGGPPKRRIRPAGNPASDLMVLVDYPDRADIDTGIALSDPVFDKMLDALSRDRASVYVAMLSPGRPVTSRLTEESISTLAVLARQHIAFVSPKQLWLVGSAASRAILGIDDAEAKGRLHDVNLSDTMIQTIATAHPRMFNGSKSHKAAAWTEMQRLIIRDDA